LREDAAEQYLAYKLVDSNTDWKTRWFYITNHHPGLPKPSGRQPRHREWWNTEPTMQEGIQLPEMLARIKVLREAGLRAEHVSFSFMSRMPGGELDDDDIIERLTRIFKDMPPYTACPVQEYSVTRPPKEVSCRTPLVE
jgi:hypothetical protein